MDPADVKISKFLSLVLRHNPGRLGLELDQGGWVSVDDLIRRANERGTSLARADIDRVVSTNDKQRFSFDESGTRIRANQGHSVSVDLQLTEKEPPDVLYHGTPVTAQKQIQREGLKKMKRHHVHLSADPETAHKVGGRRGDHVILLIAAKRMQSEGHVFYRSENGVWLTDQVPPQFLSVFDEAT